MIYVLPNLKFGYTELEPYIGHEQLELHHKKHHQAYVDGANLALDKLDKARNKGDEIDIKSTLKDLSFNLGGHLLHCLFWDNLKTVNQEIENRPTEEFIKEIEKNFGSCENFKKEFTQAAKSCEGGGWATLVHEELSDKLLINQVEKHNLLVYPNCHILLAVDVWEHAYYLDYKNDRAKYLEGIWNIIDWDVVNQRFVI